MKKFFISNGVYENKNESIDITYISKSFMNGEYYRNLDDTLKKCFERMDSFTDMMRNVWLVRKVFENTEEYKLCIKIKNEKMVSTLVYERQRLTYYYCEYFQEEYNFKFLANRFLKFPFSFSCYSKGYILPDVIQNYFHFLCREIKNFYLFSHYSSKSIPFSDEELIEKSPNFNIRKRKKK